MLIAGITGGEGKVQTAGLINLMLASKGKKVSVIDSASFLGLDGGKTKAYISELEKNNTEFMLMKISIPDIDRFFSTDIEFDFVIYTDKVEDIIGPDRKEDSGIVQILSLMTDNGVAIVNVDDNDLIGLLQGMKNRFVTYGFNSKASITTSSIGDTVSKDGFICCLQRTMTTRNGNVIEPQEYKLKFKANVFDIHNVLAATAFVIINGIEPNSFNDNLSM